MLSIIIPTYNRADMLAEAIQSVLDQDYFLGRPDAEPAELIVVDDGSTDTTEDVVSRFGGRVIYSYQEHRGVSSARNHGLRLSRGEFIAFLDSDDLWKREKLTVQMGYMRTFPEAVMCYTEEVWIRKGRFVNAKDRHRKYSGRVFNKVLPLCLLSLSSALFRRSVFGEIGLFDESLPACEDYDFGIRLALRHPFHLIPRPLIIKRGGHEDQLSHKYSCMDDFRVRVLERILNENLTPQERELVRRELALKCRVLRNGCLKREKHDEAEKYAEMIRKYTESNHKEV